MSSIISTSFQRTGTVLEQSGTHRVLLEARVGRAPPPPVRGVSAYDIVVDVFVQRLGANR